MTRRKSRRSKSKSYTCDICDRKYATSASLYYHNYSKHRNNNNKEIIINDNDIIYNINNKNINIEDSDTVSIVSSIFSEDEELNTEANILINEELSKAFNILKPIMNSDEFKQAEKLTKPNIVTSDEFKQAINILNEQEKPTNPINIIKSEKKPIINEEKEHITTQDNIITELTSTFNKCVINNISVSFDIQINNSEISMKFKKTSVI